MATNKHKIQLQKRDWAIILLFILMIVTNFWWWGINNVHDSVENDLHNINSRQLLINNQLKTCVNEGTKTCDISSPY